MRFALGIEYNGTFYHGWQRQEHDVPTVQGMIEQALTLVASKPVNVFCAGRTDAGVHAQGQVIHFDTDIQRNENSWIFGGNSNLPRDIRILWAMQISEEFHARFSANSRSYRYMIYNHPIRPALWQPFVTWYHRPLNEKKMHEAAQFLLGEHDFSSFRGAACQSNSPVRELLAIKISRQNSFIIIDVTADSFLHHMVRNIVGVLFEIGEERKSTDWIKEILIAKDRKQAGVTAPPNGLYLQSVEYPPHFQIPLSIKSNFIDIILNN